MVEINNFKYIYRNQLISQIISYIYLMNFWRKKERKNVSQLVMFSSIRPMLLSGGKINIWIGERDEWQITIINLVQG